MAITTTTENQDAAAAYIDFITSADAMTIIAETGKLPVVDADAQRQRACRQRCSPHGHRPARRRPRAVPRLGDQTFYDTISAALQDLLAGQATPEEFLERLEAEYAAAVGG